MNTPNTTLSTQVATRLDPRLQQALTSKAAELLRRPTLTKDELQGVDAACRALAARGAVDEEVSLGLAAVYLRNSNQAAAEEILLQLVAAHPNNADAQFALGTIAKTRGDTERALGYFRLALARHPKHTASAMAILELSNDDVYRFLLQLTGPHATRAVELLAVLRFSGAPRRSAYLGHVCQWVLASLIVAAVGSGVLGVTLAAALALILLFPPAIRQLKSRDFRHLIFSLGLPLVGTALFTYLRSGSPFHNELVLTAAEINALDACEVEGSDPVPKAREDAACQKQLQACEANAENAFTATACQVAATRCRVEGSLTTREESASSSQGAFLKGSACRLDTISKAALRMDADFGKRTAMVAFPLALLCMAMAGVTLVVSGRHRRTLEFGRLIYTAGLFANEVRSVELIRVRDVAVSRGLCHLLTNDGSLRLHVDHGGELTLVDLPGVALYPDLIKIMEQVRDLSLLLRSVAGKPLIGN
jgi:hypothetical protein